MPCPIFIMLQDQYAFIHYALSDYITCGDTSVIAHDLRSVINDMSKKDVAGKSGFESQFEVWYPYSQYSVATVQNVFTAKQKTDI